MKKNRPQAAAAVSKQAAAVLALIAFAAGFLTGVGVTAYKTAASPDVAPPAVGTGAEWLQEIQALEALVARNPQNPDDWIRLGHLYFDSRQPDKAIGAYEKALALKPDNPDVLTDLGVMYRRSGQPRKAVEAFDQAIGVDPRHETARFNKGIVLLHDLNDRRGAIRTWEALLEINPLAMAPNGQSVDQLLTHYKEHLKNASD